MNQVKSRSACSEEQCVLSWARFGRCFDLKTGFDYWLIIHPSITYLWSEIQCELSYFHLLSSSAAVFLSI